MYKITVAPNYTLHMQLTFQPADLGQHYFEFPIVAAGGGKSDGLRKVAIHRDKRWQCSEIFCDSSAQQSSP